MKNMQSWQNKVQAGSSQQIYFKFKINFNHGHTCENKAELPPIPVNKNRLHRR